jgi:hypothetical protein
VLEPEQQISDFSWALPPVEFGQQSASLSERNDPAVDRRHLNYWRHRRQAPVASGPVTAAHTPGGATTGSPRFRSRYHPPPNLDLNTQSQTLSALTSSRP